jgi:hypothetical protein
MKVDYTIEPSGVDSPTKIKPRAMSGRNFKNEKGKRMRHEGSQGLKERQCVKIKELSDALVAAGFFSLDEQATALGLSRSTTWTILKAQHKNYGLSGALIDRILQKPGLDRRVRAKIIEYVQEKAAGQYGHNQTQLRRFRERLSVRSVTATVFRKKLTELKAETSRSGLFSQERDWPTSKHRAEELDEPHN